MKMYLLLVCALSFSLAFSQPGGGMQGGRQGGGQGNQMQERPQREVQEFDASKMAGIFTYDDAIVIKKLKLKKNDKLILDVRKAIANYNTRIQEIGLLNKDNFDTLNVYMNTIMKASMSNRGQDRDSQQMSGGNTEDSREGGNDEMREARELAREKITPAKRAVKEEEDKLNKTLEVLLNEKQNDKWLKYQEDVKEDLLPKRESNNQNGQMRSGGQGGGRQGGFSGGGGGMR